MRSVRWPRARCSRTRADRLGEALQQQQVAEQLPGVDPQPLDRGVLVAAVEGAEEVAPVAAVEREQRRSLARGRPR